MTRDPASERRPRNPRGQGAHLRDEIIAGATVLLERTGSEDALSLRAIAREVGISAPSISRHFSDLTEIIDAVVAEELSGLYQAIVTATAENEAPVERLFRMCQSYVEYGRAHPARYHVLIGRRYLEDWHDRDLTMARTAPLIATAIDLFKVVIQECVNAGDSASTDVTLDTFILWFTVHGLITVPAAITSLDWPDHDRLLEASVRYATRLTRGRDQRLDIE